MKQICLHCRKSSFVINDCSILQSETFYKCSHLFLKNLPACTSMLRAPHTEWLCIRFYHTIKYNTKLCNKISKIVRCRYQNRAIRFQKIVWCVDSDFQNCMMHRSKSCIKISKTVRCIDQNRAIGFPKLYDA
jgi:hypothetical protein